MKQIIPEKNPSQKSAAPLARISEPHGYQFDGDTVHLHARFVVLNPAAHQRDWKLKLWACASAPTSTHDLAGHIVAQVALPPMREAADETEHMDMSAFATPPAGDAEHFMALVLTSSQTGQPDQIHDFAVYPRRERFQQPKMIGTPGYVVNGNRVQLSVVRIQNPRSPDNCTGTLSVELWALKSPYNGGVFEGVPLAGLVIGTLMGQTETDIAAFDLDFTAPPAGDWHFALMLREWTAAGYVTRDFANFPNVVTYKTAPAPQAKAATEEKSAKTEVSAKAPVKTEAVPKVETVAKAPAKIEAAAKVETTAKTPVKAEAPKVEKAASAAKSNVSPVVSVNNATAEELSSVAGISETLAKGIVNKRPFSSLEDLQRVKGLGAKVLASIRSRLKL